MSVGKHHGTQLEIRSGLAEAYRDVFTPEAIGALETLARFDEDRRKLMEARIRRRADRVRRIDPQGRKGDWSRSAAGPF